MERFHLIQRIREVSAEDVREAGKEVRNLGGAAMFFGAFSGDLRIVVGGTISFLGGSAVDRIAQHRIGSKAGRRQD